MKFTDIFIGRPVLAMSISLLVLVLGLRSVFGLPVNQFPSTQNAVVTVSTAYYGADAQTVAGFITQPLESAIAQAQGIDYLSSTSSSGVSNITATLRLNYEATRALTEISTQISSVRNQLPPQAQQPVLTVQTGATTDAMYLGFYSDVLPTNNITDYLLRVVKPKLDSVTGVQTAEILGGRPFALRAWLDSNKLAAYGVTAADVSAALVANNYLAALGSSKGQMVSVPLTAGTDLHTVAEFKQLVVKGSGDAVVRLQDVATVTLGAENYDFNVAFSGKRSVFIGIKVAPEANILDVARRVREAFPPLQAQLPAGVTGKIVYDATEFINTSIDEVVKTLVEALFTPVTYVVVNFLKRHEHEDFYDRHTNFTPFSVMMKNIHSGWGVPQRRNEEIVILVSSLHHIRQLGLPFVFTNAHAYPDWTNYYSDLAQLGEIDGGCCNAAISSAMPTIRGKWSVIRPRR